jgi:hypothetical protein
VLYEVSNRINRYKSIRAVVYSTPAGESRSDVSETVYDWKNDQLLQNVKEYDLCVMMLMRQVCFSVYNY